MQGNIRKLDMTMTLAQTSDCTMRLGAIIFDGNRPISMSTNKKKTNPNIAYPSRDGKDLYNCFHAETAAIFKCKDKSKLIGSTIVVARVTKRGMPRLSKPCPICMKHIQESGIKKIIYTTGEYGYAIEKIGRPEVVRLPFGNSKKQN